MKNYYSILGLDTDAEDVVIKAAYRSLCQKYHPDKWLHDTAFATKKLQEINEAYAVLSDLTRKADFDEVFKKSQQGTDYAFASKTMEDDVFDESNEAWSIAIGFYPEIERYYQYLRNFRGALANEFKGLMLETKKFNDARAVAVRLEHNFLNTYFGDDKDVLKLARELLLKRLVEEAKLLNKLVNTMGASVSARQYESQLTKTFPDLQAKLASTQKSKSDLQSLAAKILDRSIALPSEDVCRQLCEGLEILIEDKRSGFFGESRIVLHFKSGRIESLSRDTFPLWVKTELASKVFNGAYPQ